MESDCLYCLSLIDGKLLWKCPREDDLYVACVDRDKVVLVGRSGVRARRLADGKPAWGGRTVAFPDNSMPSGRGFWSGDDAVLPALEQRRGGRHRSGRRQDRAGLEVPPRKRAGQSDLPSRERSSPRDWKASTPTANWTWCGRKCGSGWRPTPTTPRRSRWRAKSCWIPTSGRRRSLPSAGRTSWTPTRGPASCSATRCWKVCGPTSPPIAARPRRSSGCWTIRRSARPFSA